jgi:hypothetical protein
MNKSTRQSKCAMPICRFAVVMSAAHVVPGVVEVVALLGCIQGGFCCSSAVREIIDQVVAAVEDKPGPTTFHHQRPAGCDT